MIQNRVLRGCLYSFSTEQISKSDNPLRVRFSGNGSIVIAVLMVVAIFLALSAGYIQVFSVFTSICLAVITTYFSARIFLSVVRGWVSTGNVRDRETVQVKVDAAGVNLQSHLRKKIYTWNEVEYLEEADSRTTIWFRDKYQLSVRTIDIGNHEIVDSFFRFVRKSIELFGLQPNDYYRFVHWKEEIARELISVIVDVDGVRILNENGSFHLPWYRIEALDLQDEVVVIEPFDRPSCPFLLAEFKNASTLEAFLQFVECQIAMHKLQ